MPKLMKLFDDHVQITITAAEVLELRVQSNMSETTGQIIQDMITRTLGLEEEDQYWYTDIVGAADATWDEDLQEWKYLYKMKSTYNLIF